MTNSSKKGQLTKLDSGQYIDDSGRKLIAKGYIFELHPEEATLIMEVWDEDGYNDEEFWQVDGAKIPPGSVVGSYMRLFEDEAALELYAPAWTEEEIDEIKKKAEEYGKLMASFFEDDES